MMKKSRKKSRIYTKNRPSNVVSRSSTQLDSWSRLEEQKHIKRLRKLRQQREQKDRADLKSALFRLKVAIKKNEGKRIANDINHIQDITGQSRRYRKAAELDAYRRKVCRDRDKKRQSLFARRKIGKGMSGPKKRKYTEKSAIRCR
jgi:hypothetical protein